MINYNKLNIEKKEIVGLAVSLAGRNILYIENPSEELFKLALRTDGEMIMYIKDPSEELQLISVESTFGFSLKFIKNPTEKVKLLAEKLSCVSQEFDNLIKQKYENQ